MISKNETPHEKLARLGVSALSDIELLQTMICYGSDNSESRKIARDVNAAMHKFGVSEVTLGYIKEVKGVGDSKAAAVIAALEFGRRKHMRQDKPLIDSPEAAAQQVGFIRDKKQEHFVMLTLDGARRLIKTRTITIGTLMSSLVHPREVFSPAIEDRAASIIVAHNHPSGMLSISKEDREVSRLIRQAGELLGMRADGYSVREIASARRNPLREIEDMLDSALATARALCLI